MIGSGRPDLPGLDERQDLEQLVHRAEPAREDHQRAGEIGEPQLAHEEVVELEQKVGGDERIGPLLGREADGEADRSDRPPAPPRRGWPPP
jgi:hypothetical protein